jgi:hypothetical protein
MRLYIDDDSVDPVLNEGILVVRYDNNPRNNMSSGDIARAVRNLGSAGLAIADSLHELNHWQ